MTRAQLFLEKYADTPIGCIDAAEAKKILMRSGYLTKSGRVSSRYADVIVKHGVQNTERNFMKRTTPDNEGTNH